MPRYAHLIVIDADDAKASWESVTAAMLDTGEAGGELMFATGPLAIEGDPEEADPDYGVDYEPGGILHVHHAGRPVELYRVEEYD